MAAEYTSLHFRKVIWAMDRHLGVISLKMIFKAMRSNEIAEREREEREKAPRDTNVGCLERRKSWQTV